MAMKTKLDMGTKINIKNVKKISDVNSMNEKFKMKQEELNKIYNK